MVDHIRRAILLVGPTGSGKSPLGDLLAQETGWAHFDFGAELRHIASMEYDGNLAEENQLYVSELLSKHLLLPDDRFEVAAGILIAFIGQNASAPGIILNGMPRHEGQARAVGKILDVERVILLECSAEAASHRIKRRLKGMSSDHAGRPDDTPEALPVKLSLFEEKTKPLIEYYEGRGVPVTRLTVEANTAETTLVKEILLEWPPELDRTIKI